MKAYGKDRRGYANRKLRGTSMACPCCIPSSTHRKSQTKAYQKRARQEAQRECRSRHESEDQ
jgi:hypothetical protein